MVHEHTTQLQRIPIDINTPLLEGIERMKGPGNGCRYLVVYFIHVQLSFPHKKSISIDRAVNLSKLDYSFFSFFVLSCQCRRLTMELQ